MTEPRDQGIWGSLLRNVLLPCGDLVFGQPMMHRLRFLEEAQWWDPGRIRNERNRLLNHLIHTAYQEVPFYREWMQEHRVAPGEIRSAKDLIRLPIATKELLSTGFPERVTRATGQEQHDVHTSGSTGLNFVVKEDAYTAGWYRAAFLLMLEWAGWRIGEPHVQTGMTLHRSLDRRIKDALMRCHYVSAFDLTDRHLDRTLALLEQKGIEHLWGYSSSLYFLARRAAEVGWNRPLRSIVTWGDNLYSWYRATVEQAFRCRVFDTYGCGEGVQVSAQCGHGAHYHIFDLDTIVEFVNDDGAPAEQSEPANLLLTRLHPGPMPLIRYRVGDMGIQGRKRSCECGRGFGLMQDIEGRDTDVVYTPLGNRLIVEFFNGILDDYPEVECFLVVQEELESIVLTLVPTSAYRPETGRRLIQEMHRKGAEGLEIRIELAGELPLPPSGKRRYVISRIDRRNAYVQRNAEHL
jgi:phenylacetate-CoA ligase